MTKTINARGLSCPQPVLMFLEAVKSFGDTEFEVLVDTEASRENVSRAVERRLKQSGWDVRVMEPPPEMQTGCDLVIVFPLIAQLEIVRLLAAGNNEPLQVVPVTDPLLEPVSLFQTKDFGDYLMIRAANMKITVDKQTRIIVNVSGGGCPDVPWLAGVMVGQPLDAAPDPLEIGHTPVFGFLAGDTGKGRGSRDLYEHLVDNVSLSRIHTLVFHYLQPDTDWYNRVLFRLQDLENAPILIADAGFMYAAKMSGAAPSYDLFTPDAGELAFLADETAPHPFYTRGFILHTDNPVTELVDRAYAHDNAARYLLIKGAVDYVMNQQGELFRVEGPSHEAMEATLKASKGQKTLLENVSLIGAEAGCKNPTTNACWLTSYPAAPLWGTAQQTLTL